MKKLNNDGFTLIELLAVLVILTAIMGIAIPTISSSLERNKDKQDKAKQKLFENAAELYVSNHKNEVYRELENNNLNFCYIELKKLVEEDLLSADSILKSDGKEFDGLVKYNKIDKTFTYTKEGSGNKCVN